MTQAVLNSMKGRAKAKFGNGATIETSASLVQWMRDMRAEYIAGVGGAGRPVKQPQPGDEALALAIYQEGQAVRPRIGRRARP